MKGSHSFLMVALCVFFMSGCGTTPVIDSSQNDNTQNIDQAQKTQFYSNETFSVEYPIDFVLKEESKALIRISNEKGSIEIGDFEPTAAPIPESEEKEAEFPKDIQYHGKNAKIASALFYKLDDALTMEQFKQIQKTIQVK